MLKITQLVSSMRREGEDAEERCKARWEKDGEKRCEREEKHVTAPVPSNSLAGSHQQQMWCGPGLEQVVRRLLRPLAICYREEEAGILAGRGGAPEAVVLPAPPELLQTPVLFHPHNSLLLF